MKNHNRTQFLKQLALLFFGAVFVSVLYAQLDIPTNINNAVQTIGKIVLTPNGQVPSATNPAIVTIDANASGTDSALRVLGSVNVSPDDAGANILSGISSSVIGRLNTLFGNSSFIVGVQNFLNSLNKGVSAIISSANSSLTGGNSIILGGGNNRVNGDYATAGGQNAQANHPYTWVWSDYDGSYAFSSPNFASVNPNTFLIRAKNGVGINTNNPAAALDVNGTSRFAQDVTLSPGKSIQFGNGGPGGAYGGFNWNLSNDSASMYAREVSADQTDYVFKMADNAAGDRFVWWIQEWQGPSYDVYPMILAGNYANFYGGAIYIDSLKNIGIGKVNPADKLDVAGGALFGSTTERLSLLGAGIGFNRKVVDGTIFNTSAHAYQFNHTASTTPTSDYLALQVYSPSGAGVNSQALTVNGAGNVGINTNTPTYPLDVNGPAAATSLVQKNAANRDHTRIWHDGSMATYDAGGAENGIQFRIGNGSEAPGAQTYTTAMKLLPGGVVNAGGNYYNVLSYGLNGTPANGIKIKTKIPYTNGSHMPLITIEGYDYGARSTVGISLVWYVWDGNFYAYGASSSANTAPVIKLANEGGLVTIHLAWTPYYGRFNVRAYAQGVGETPTWFQGWSAVDEAPGASNQVTVAYSNTFPGTVNFAGGIWTPGGNVGIGTTTPNFKLHVAGEAYASNGFRVASSNGDNVNNAPWYGLGASNLDLYGGGHNSVQLAGYWGLNFKTNVGQMVLRGDNGNLGIGTTTPQVKLDVAGQTNIMGQTTNGTSHYQFEGGTYRDPASHTPSLLVREDNGSVGMNGFKPALSLYNNDGSLDSTVGLAFVSKESNGGGNSVDLAGIAAVKESAGNNNGWSQGGLQFFVKNYGPRVDALRIKSNGNVGIGTTDPSARLTVNSSTDGGGNVIAAFGGLSSQRILFYDELNASQGPKIYSNAGYPFILGGASDIILQPAGNVGIGTTSPSKKLTIQGDHGNTQLLLHSLGGGSTATEADMMLWASEPGHTYQGVGISNNVYNTTNFPRISTTRGGSYMRLLDNGINLSTVDGGGTTTTPLVVGPNTVTINGRLNASEISTPTLIVDKLVNRTVTNIQVNGQLLPDTSAPATSQTIGNISTSWKELYAGGITALANGNVGIGTTPTQPLEVYKANTHDVVKVVASPGYRGYSVFQFGESQPRFYNIGSAIWFGPGNAVVDAGFARTSLGNLKVVGNNGGAGNLLVAGALGVGTDTPTQKLEVLGNIKSTTKMQSPQYCDINGNNCMIPNSGYVTGSTLNNYVTVNTYNTLTASLSLNYVPKWNGTAMVNSTIIDRNGSISMGTSQANGSLSTAMGYQTQASGYASMAMGRETRANGYYSTAMGLSTQANAYATTAMGVSTQANGQYSTAMGVSTQANGQYSTVMGKYNLGLTNSLLEIGMGVDSSNKANALTVYDDGRVVAPISMQSPSFLGNATTATNLSTNSTNWNSNGTISAVVGQLAWKNYGNGHTIFDASAGTSPSGTSIDKSNPQNIWSSNYPTLMGWNGSNTYGVKVDRARLADTAYVATTADYATSAGTANYATSAGTANYANAIAYNNTASMNYNAQFMQLSTGNIAGDNPTNGWVSLIKMNHGNGDNYYNRTLAFDFFSDNIYTRKRVAGTATVWKKIVLSDINDNISLAGTITAAGFYYSSDITLKKDIKSLDSALSKINKLNGYSFSWKSTDKKDIGVIAQEVEKVFPELVHTDDAGIKSVEYGNLVAPIIEAIKELSQKLENLFAKYVDQEARIDALEQRLQKLENK